jgi:Uma2 family endonuclease
LSDLPPPGGWTVDDLYALPEDGVRRELLDGVVLTAPSPTDTHQIIAGRLGVALEESCPDEFQVTQGVEIRFDPRRALIPDVLVATDEAARRRGRHYRPGEVVLAIEIVSPTSVTMDRVTKPALYASGGIPHYWRIEMDDGIHVHTYKIDPESEMYRPFGTFSDEIDAVEPWPIKLPIAKLRPRFL